MNSVNIYRSDERAVILGEYIVNNNATVRATAKKFMISKSTVHKDVAERLLKINPVSVPARKFQNSTEKKIWNAAMNSLDL